MPRAGRSWRVAVAAAAAGRGAGPAELRLDFATLPRQFVDLDSLVESTVAGLRDAGWYGRGLGGLDGVLATRVEEAGVGVTASGGGVRRAKPPGPVALAVEHDRVPRARPAKLAWRDRLATAWGGREPLGEVPTWVDVALGAGGSLLGGLEPLLDALEPVLGRDPRGRQELFPNDHLVAWLRVRRATASSPAVRLRLGVLATPGPGVAHS